jgi:hypothetical protein
MIVASGWKALRWEGGHETCSDTTPTNPAFGCVRRANMPPRKEQGKHRMGRMEKTNADGPCEAIGITSEQQSLDYQ